MADNFHVTIKASIGHLQSSLSIALALHQKITGYRDITGSPAMECLKPKDIDAEQRRLILFWHNVEDVIPFPAPMKPEQIAPFIVAWLDSVSFGPRPDIDGDTGKGFYISTGAGWNFVEDVSHYACLDIRPCWMMYGK
jgi:hypothetical protein